MELSYFIQELEYPYIKSPVFKHRLIVLLIRLSSPLVYCFAFINAQLNSTFNSVLHTLQLSTFGIMRSPLGIHSPPESAERRSDARKNETGGDVCENGRNVPF